MTTYILIAMVLVGASLAPRGGREVPFTVEFSSLEKCNAAGDEMTKKWTYKEGTNLIVSVDYICVEK